MKFVQAQGALKLTLAKVEESTNPKGSTVSANVLFEGKTPIRVRYILTFRDGKIANEIWQIDPKLVISDTIPTADPVVSPAPNRGDGN
jgi:hypothetical protein